MTEILQDQIPPDMIETRALPGVQPLADGVWLRVDDAYGAQMARRRDLISQQLGDVYRMDPMALPAAQEILRAALRLLPDLGFDCDAASIRCPDGQVIKINWDAPLITLGQAVQEDICIMEKRGDEHVLTGAMLCFPASWSLDEKFLRPLIGIHRRVEEYDDGLARRVQRLFDGVQAGRPLWRFNNLRYAGAELYQPHRESDPRSVPSPESMRYRRAERQCIARMPDTGAVVFSIHTYVVAAQEETE